jgi:glycosyltransferase involved in cell wall biosynthesis
MRPVERWTAAGEMTIEGRPVGELGLQAPLVSVVVVNWNYARFIGATIDSILRQDYPRFECLVVDNASTDDSRAVISRHVGDDPRFTVLHLDKNHGQMGGVQIALDRIHGEFATFLDADDLWFSNFISSHVQVHLALPLGIALTSSRVIEINADGQVISRCNFGFGFNSFEDGSRGLQPKDKVPRIPNISDADFELLSTKTTRINPEATGYFWSPGSANVYRHNILNLARPDVAERNYSIARDIHFNRLCHILGGSAAIDRALSAYRIHDANASSALPSMLHIGNVKRERAKAHRRQLREILRILLARAEDFSWMIKGRYWRALDQASGERSETLAEYYANPEIEQIITEYAPQLVAVFGSDEVAKELGQRLPAACAPRFCWTIAGDRYWEVLDGLTRNIPDLRSYFDRPEVSSLFVQYYDRLVQASGEARVLRELRKRYRTMAWHRIIRRAHRGKLPLPIAREMILIDMQLIIHRLMRTLRVRQGR